MDTSQIASILHRNLIYNHLSYKENCIFLPCAESKCQKYLMSEKLLKNYDIFKKSWVKKGSKLNNPYYSNEIW